VQSHSHHLWALLLQDLSTTFQNIFPDITPESKRLLLAHVARTANVSAADLGLPMSEVQKVLGLKVREEHSNAKVSYVVKNMALSDHVVTMRSGAFCESSLLWYWYCDSRKDIAQPSVMDALS
jgi:hypothetical protein